MPVPAPLEIQTQSSSECSVGGSRVGADWIKSEVHRVGIPSSCNKSVLGQRGTVLMT